MAPCTTCAKAAAAVAGEMQEAIGGQHRSSDIQRSGLSCAGQDRAAGCGSPAHPFTVRCTLAFVSCHMQNTSVQHSVPVGSLLGQQMADDPNLTTSGINLHIHFQKGDLLRTLTFLGVAFEGICITLFPMMLPHHIFTLPELYCASVMLSRLLPYCIFLALPWLTARDRGCSDCSAAELHRLGRLHVQSAVLTQQSCLCLVACSFCRGPDTKHACMLLQLAVFSCSCSIHTVLASAIAIILITVCQPIARYLLGLFST